MGRFALGVLSMWVLAANAEPSPAEVLLFGVFHFANRGHDVVRVEQGDVSTPNNQKYLAGRIASRDIKPYL